MRLIPDVVRLLRRLAADRTLPRSVSVRLWCLLIYLISPIDLIPDFIPVLGYADDAIIVTIALRSITRRAGPQALGQRWPGTPEGLSTLLALAGITPRARPESSHSARRVPSALTRPRSGTYVPLGGFCGWPHVGVGNVEVPGASDTSMGRTTHCANLS